MAKRRVYRSLLVDRVDLVDRGANFDRPSGDGSHVLLMKRHAPADTTLDVDAEELQKLIDAAVAKAMAEQTAARAAAAALAAPPNPAAKADAQEKPNMSVSISVRKAIDDAISPARDLGALELQHANFVRLDEDPRIEAVAGIAKFARDEGRRRGVPPRIVLDERVLDAAAIVKNAKPTLSFPEAVDAARAMMPAVRLASREVHGER